MYNLQSDFGFTQFVFDICVLGFVMLDKIALCHHPNTQYDNFFEESQKVLKNTVKSK